MLRHSKGCLIDSVITKNLIYLNSFLWNQMRMGLWSEPLGKNIFDGGAPFYQFYQCKCGRYMSVGCLEEKFYAEWIEGLRRGGLEDAEYFLLN